MTEKNFYLFLYNNKEETLRTVDVRISILTPVYMQGSASLTDGTLTIIKPWFFNKAFMKKCISKLKPVVVNPFVLLCGCFIVHGKENKQRDGQTNRQTDRRTKPLVNTGLVWRKMYLSMTVGTKRIHHSDRWSTPDLVSFLFIQPFHNTIPIFKFFTLPYIDHFTLTTHPRLCN